MSGCFGGVVWGTSSIGRIGVHESVPAESEDYLWGDGCPGRGEEAWAAQDLGASGFRPYRSGAGSVAAGRAGQARGEPAGTGLRRRFRGPAPQHWGGRGGEILAVAGGGDLLRLGSARVRPDRG